MRERPVLFQGEMVRALLAGTKAQTRRAVKWRGLEPGLNLQFSGLSVERSGSNWVLSSPTRTSHEYRSVPMPCPYGQPGDRLWVRETYFAFGRWETRFSEKKGRDEWHFVDMTLDLGLAYRYSAETDELPHMLGRKLAGGSPMWWKRPAIFMPRAASRILLDVSTVRIERLQAISEEDASAEGCDRLRDDEPGYVDHEEPDWKLCPQCGGTRLYTSYGANLGACFDTDCTRCDTYVKRYRWLWESINGEGSWDANPWVWVVEFRRTQA